MCLLGLTKRRVPPYVSCRPRTSECLRCALISASVGRCGAEASPHRLAKPLGESLEDAVQGSSSAFADSCSGTNEKLHNWLICRYMQSPECLPFFESRWHSKKGQAQLVGPQDDNKGTEPQHISFVILNQESAQAIDGP
jgi:hypothetical protein